VLRTEGQNNRFFVRGGLELEAETPAKALSQGEPIGAVDPAAERRVHHELHTAALVEEPFEDDPRLGGYGAEGLGTGRNVFTDLANGSTADAFGLERFGLERGLANLGERARKLGRARRRLTEPEWDGRRSTLRVGHPHDAATDADDSPRSRAELEDVAAVRLDGEVFVQRADERAFRFEDHLVVGVVGDGAARRHRGDARAARGAERFAHAVAVKQRPAAREMNADGCVELLARERAVGPCSTECVVEPLFVPGLGHARGDDLLREDVERFGPAGVSCRARRRGCCARARPPRRARRV